MLLNTSLFPFVFEDFMKPSIYFDDSQVKSLIHDAKRALDEERSFPGSAETLAALSPRSGFPTQVSAIFQRHFVPLVRQNMKDSKTGSHKQRKSANKLVYFYRDRKTGKLMHRYFDRIAASLRKPENQGHFPVRMIKRELIKTAIGFFIGIGNIVEMNKRTMLRSRGGKTAPLWRILEDGAKASGPYDAAHQGPAGRDGWIATYDSAGGVFRLVGRTMKGGNPSREGKKFFEKAFLSVQQGKLRILPMVYEAATGCLRRVWRSKRPIRRTRTSG